ncbi:MAG: cation diffusion facilitator family transporter [Elusimicrobiota bacterium]
MCKKKGVALFSVYSNSILVFSKLIIGFLTGSVSILSEAIHSATDLIASIIAYLAVQKSAIPPDEEHKFGHGKIENISGFIEAILIFLAAGWLIYESIKKLIYPQNIEMIWFGIVVMSISSIINIYVSRKLMKVSAETNSIALKADAIHLRTDVYTSAGVMLGLFLIWALEKIFLGKHFHWIDPLVAILVAILIIKAAWKLTKESFSDLIDTSINQSEISKIKKVINADKEVIGFKNMRTKKAGNKTFIEFDILLDNNISLTQAHKITDDLTFKIQKEISNSEVIIHIEPCENQCTKECKTNCKKQMNYNGSFVH